MIIMRVLALALFALLQAPAVPSATVMCAPDGPSRPVVAGVPFRVGFCAEAVAFNGYRLIVDGAELAEPRAFERTEDPSTVNGDHFYWTPAAVVLSAGPHSISVVVIGPGGEPSAPSPPLLLDVARGTPDPCAAPFGADALTVTVTRWTRTTGRPGSRMRLDFQLASKSAVVEIAGKLAGNVVARIGDAESTVDVGAAGGIWFTTPDAGTYPLSVYARNAAGCTSERPSAVDLVVPR